MKMIYPVEDLNTNIIPGQEDKQGQGTQSDSQADDPDERKQK